MNIEFDVYIFGEKRRWRERKLSKREDNLVLYDFGDVNSR